MVVYLLNNNMVGAPIRDVFCDVYCLADEVVSR